MIPSWKEFINDRLHTSLFRGLKNSKVLNEYGEDNPSDSFAQINYRGKPLERDTSAKSGVLHINPVRNHWWQLWRKKQTYIDFKALNFRGVPIAIETNADGSVTICKEIVEDMLADESLPIWIRKMF